MLWKKSLYEAGFIFNTSLDHLNFIKAEFLCHPVTLSRYRSINVAKTSIWIATRGTCLLLSCSRARTTGRAKVPVDFNVRWPQGSCSSFYRRVTQLGTNKQTNHLKGLDPPANLALSLRWLYNQNPGFRQLLEHFILCLPLKWTPSHCPHQLQS